MNIAEGYDSHGLILILRAVSKGVPALDSCSSMLNIFADFSKKCNERVAAAAARFF
jgi:hypothetical protein